MTKLRGFLSARRRSALPQVAACLMLLAFTSSVAVAQQRAALFDDVLPPPPHAAAPQKEPAKDKPEEEEFIKPSRPTVSNPAEFQKPGVLQIEYGYDANFRAQEFSTQQATPLALRLAAHKRLLLEADLDVVKSETDAETGERKVGIGDAQLGFQVVALEDTDAHPALAFAYYVKLPTASESKGLGTGRFDHTFVWLLSKKVGETDVDFNAAYLAVGQEGGGWLHGGQGALSFSRDLNRRWGLQGEFSGQSVDAQQPRGLYALGALTYKASRRLTLDGGARFGLNPAAPRVGVFAGLTVGVVDFFKVGR